MSRFGAHSGGFDLPRLRVWTMGIEAFVCAVVIVACARQAYGLLTPRNLASGDHARGIAIARSTFLSDANTRTENWGTAN